MKKMRKFTKSKMISRLWQSIALLEGPNEVKKFLEDILYPSEVSMLGQRLLIASLIRKGFDYRQIITLTGASVTTVHRVLAVMHRGTAGYELALSNLAQLEEYATYKNRQYDKDPLTRYTHNRLRKGK